MKKQNKKNKARKKEEEEEEDDEEEENVGGGGGIRKGETNIGKSIKLGREHSLLYYDFKLTSMAWF